MRGVRLGGPLTLVSVGLILALAISNSIEGVDLHMIGWIIAGAGVTWFVLDLALNQSGKSVREVRESRGLDASGRKVIRQERHEER